MFYLRDWFETKKSAKDSEWASRVIRFIRMYMSPLVSLDEAERGMSYLLARQDMSYVRNLFQDPAKINLTDERAGRRPVAQRSNGQNNNNNNSSGNGNDEFLQKEMRTVNFRPINLLEKPFRISVAEMKKMGAIVNVRSVDPTSTQRRQSDKDLLKNKRDIEADLTEIYTRIGQPPVDLAESETRFGEKAANGNVEEFAAMGLDDGDPADINQFMKHFHKLDEEIAAQGPIDYCMEYNQVSDKTELWVTDIWAKKAVAGAVHVSDTNGSIMYDYLAPETVWIYGGGRRKDFNDANAKAYQQKVSIKELLDRFGNSFDFSKDFERLMQAITFAGNSVEFTGIRPSWQGFVNGDEFLNGKDGSRYGYNNFLSFKVTVGYIEFTSQNQEMFGEVDTEGNGFAQNNHPEDGERYQTKARYETPTYKSFYLAVSTVDQILFNFGEMTYQQIEGYDDFNVNFSIVTYKEIGDPLCIMAAPFIDIFHELWFKWKYEIRRALPPGVSYNYDSLMTMAEDLMSDQEISREGKLQKMVEWLDSSANDIWAFPVIDGKTVPITASQLNIPKANGLSPEVTRYWEMMVNVLDEMQDVLTGRAPLRQGDPGGSRDSMNNQFKALEYSQNATYYIPDMLTYMYQQLASKTMLYVQDIIQYKKYNTLAYNFLVTAVGEEVLIKLFGLGKKAMHRYGIFVESLNQAAARAKLSARIDFALQNGKITNAQALLVEDIKSPSKAYLWLAYFEERTDRKMQQRALEMQKDQREGLMQLEQMKQETIRLEGSYMLQGKQLDANAQMQSHIITQTGGITKSAMKHASDAELIEQQAKADMGAMSESIDRTGKVNAPPPPPMLPQGMAGGPPPAQQRPLSGIQESMRDSEPTSTEGVIV